MKTILISVFILILLAGGIMLYRYSYVKRKFRKQATQRYSIVSPLIQKLNSNQRITRSEVLIMVEDPALRHGVFRVLEAYNRNDLFPAEYFTREKGAEGFLVNWLEFPTELGRPPDMIMLMKIVTLELDLRIHYYVFKFKTTAPRWASKFGWMMGVCGPYNQSSLPFDVPERVFSRFNPVGLLTPDAEATWVHESINVNFKKAQ